MMSTQKSDKKIFDKDILEAIRIADIRKNEFTNNIKLLKQKISFLNNKSNEFDKLKKETNNASDTRTILKIGNKLHLNLNPSPIYSNLCKQIILNKIDNNMEKTLDQIEEIKHSIEQLQKDLENIYLCPTCGGSGTIIEVEHLREDGRITTLRRPRECVLCKGKGRIK